MHNLPYAKKNKPKQFYNTKHLIFVKLYSIPETVFSPCVTVENIYFISQKCINLILYLFHEDYIQPEATSSSP